MEPILNPKNVGRMVTPEGELRSGSQSLFQSEVEVLSTLSHPNIVRCGFATRSTSSKSSRCRTLPWRPSPGRC